MAIAALSPCVLKDTSTDEMIHCQKIAHLVQNLSQNTELKLQDYTHSPYSSYRMLIPYYEGNFTLNQYIATHIYPNDVMDIVVVGASGESTTSTARSDYSLFYEIYQDQQNYKNGQLAQIPALTGSEVTGSQFKHRYVGTSATDTVYASDLRKCKKASDVASILATAWGSTPAAVISSTASFIFDQMLQSMSSDCYKVTISSITYEVLFSYDNSYYTHCYHQTVKEYKSNGSLIRSKTDYYQAIGG